MTNKQKLILATIIFLILMLLGACKVEAVTLDTVNTIIIQSGGYTELKRCNSSNYCFTYNKNDVRGINMSFQYKINSGEKYKFTVRFGYMFGKNSYLDDAGLDEKYVFLYNASGQEQRLSCSVDRIELFKIDNGEITWDDIPISGLMTFERYVDCEFTASINADVIGFAVRSTSDAFTAGAGLLYESMELVRGENVIDIIDNSNKNQQQTNERLDEVNNHLKDLDNTLNSTEGPSNLDDMADIAGYFPAGPIDSILNLPLSFAQNLLNSIQGQCSPVELPLPFIGGKLTIPCINDLYSQIRGLDILINSIGIIGGVLILYNYLCHLKDWLDSVLTLSIRTDWGGMFDSSNRGGSN